MKNIYHTQQWQLCGALLLLFSLCLSATSGRAQSYQGLVPDSTEMRVLRQFYYATDGPHWTDAASASHWPATEAAWASATLEDAAAWPGIAVFSGDIVALFRSKNGLRGYLPASLGMLTKLSYFALPENPGLTGVIPAGLGQTELSTLDLHSCRLTGPIPPALGAARGLNHVILQGNRLTGPLPASLGQLTNLYSLNLSYNQLTGTIPDAWGSLGRLGTLDLSHNQLDGALPASLGGMTSMEYCFLGHNQFSGLLPKSLEAWQHIHRLHLEANQFSGALPDYLAAVPALYSLYAYQNQLTSLPSWAANTAAAPVISIAENHLDFASLEINYPVTGSCFIPVFDFAPQKTKPADTLRFVAGTHHVLHRSMKGTYNHYQWQRQVGQAWVELPGQTDTTLALGPATAAMEGFYRLRVWNERVTSTYAGQGHPSLYTQSSFVDVLPYTPLAENLPVESSQILPPTDVLAPPITSNPAEAGLNYVRTYAARQAFTDVSQLIQAPVEAVQVKTDYSDGLGRPMQTVLRQESPLRRDIVQPTGYDGFGRQPKTYLPYTSPNPTGSVDRHRANAIREQYEFYHDAPAGPGAPTQNLARTGVPYSETAFEPSPLGRPLAQAAPGEAWQLATDHIQTYQERPNTVADGIRQFTVNNDNQTTDLGLLGGYTAGDLWVKETRDEHRFRTAEFQNKQGQTILKRVETALPQSRTSNSLPTQWLDTYYVYDDFGRLRVVVPPKAVAQFRVYQWQLTDAVSPLLFRYRYDARGRLIAKHIPGTDGETQLVYDRLDRVVLSQDAAQRLRQEWAFTKYDALGRPILTGLCTRNARQDSLQAEANRTTLQFEVRTTTPTSNCYYTLAQAYPPLSATSSFTRPQGLTLTDYDDYNFDNDAAGQADVIYDSQYDSQFAPGQQPRPDLRVVGQVTRTRARVLDLPETAPGAWLTTTTFYDQQGRPVQVRSTNCRGGEDVITSQLDFAGKTLKTYAVHSDSRPGALPLTITETHTYDHTGRLLTTAQQLSGETQPVVIAALAYNELGQLQQKRLGLGNQSVDYRYNIRGWLTHINGAEQQDPTDLWGMELYYDHGFTNGYQQYNGNITGQKWRSKADQTTRAYGYVYDGSNRLLQGDFVARTTAGIWTAEKQNYGLRFVSYDENGNILTLRRRGLLAPASRTAPRQYGSIDQLAYTYTGNRLLAVDDAVKTNGPTVAGAPALAGDFQDNGSYHQTYQPAEYQYDANGNLTLDRNKGITSIRYNHLNLPHRVVLGNDSIVFRYAASGQKVAKLVYQTGKPVQQTDYAGPFQYEQDTLRFFPHAEGRVLCSILDPAGQPQRRFVREYSLKDHLGNLRVAYRNGDSAVYRATMEATPANTARREEQQFDYLSITTTRFMAGSAARTGSYVARLNAAVGQSIGPLKTLRVHQGDTVIVTASGMYQQEVRPNGRLLSVLGLAAGFIQQPVSPLATTEPRSRLRPLPFMGIGVALVPALQRLNHVPQGYMRLLVFNADSVLVDTQTQQLTAGAKNNYEPLHLQVISPTDGYIKAYVGNESDTDVLFDDLEVKYNPGLVIQENNYDPWGLSLVGIDRAGELPENKYQYNGIELQRELNLNLYNAPFRLYDPQIARFNSVDPIIKEHESPYSWNTNNPLLNADPSGADSTQRANAVAKAQEYVDNKKAGNQYKMGAKGAPGEQVDCSGLVSGSVVAGGEENPNHGDKTSGVLNIESNAEEVNIGDVQPGNIVTFRYDKGYAYHTGIVKSVEKDASGNIVKVNYIQSSSGIGPNEASYDVGASSGAGAHVNGYYKWDTAPDSQPNKVSTSQNIKANNSTQIQTMGQFNKFIYRNITNKTKAKQ
ncbi:DUF6443 domain-containing protein [Hymenobacter algoricola]|uniref:DUF6443 domain-containing protein n=1 Tax=Hymenobacter algoricola TaxID=486267 RepID=A0ABP7N1W2_9BACT